MFLLSRCSQVCFDVQRDASALGGAPQCVTKSRSSTSSSSTSKRAGRSIRATSDGDDGENVKSPPSPSRLGRVPPRPPPLPPPAEQPPPDEPGRDLRKKYTAHRRRSHVISEISTAADTAAAATAASGTVSDPAPTAVAVDADDAPSSTEPDASKESGSESTEPPAVMRAGCSRLEPAQLWSLASLWPRPSAREASAGLFNVGRHSACVLGKCRMARGAAAIEPEFSDRDTVFSGASTASKFCDRLKQQGVAVACKKGRKAEQPNQDNFFFCETDAYLIFGVADGHGRAGHWASHWVAVFILWLTWVEVMVAGGLPSDDAFARIFDAAHRTLKLAGAAEKPFDLMFSGSTLSVCVVDRQEHALAMAWVGDSRCVVGQRNTGKAGGECVASTKDHKPEEPVERRRILSEGGEVVQLEGDVPHRVFARHKNVPGLAMSRAVGDLKAHSVGVIHVPGVVRTTLQAGQFVLCCSDGVWEFIENQEAVNLVAERGPECPGEAVEALAQEARTRWLKEEEGVSIDDITAVLVWITS